MILSVSGQVIVFLWTTVCGMAIAFVYDLFRIFRKAVKTGSLVTFVQDVMYWLITAFIMFLTIYYSNDGELRGFLFLGAFIGVVLYALMLSRIIMSSSLFIIRVTVKIVKLISFVVMYPFRLVIKLIAIPVRKLAYMSADAIRRERDRRRANKEKAKIENAIKARIKKENAIKAKENRAKIKADKSNAVKANRKKIKAAKVNVPKVNKGKARHG
jgi:spore cortex biosynthesis protein YabQ